MGCASIARRSVIPAILETDALELVAVSSRTEKKANEFADEFGCKSIVGYQNLLDSEEIDAVYMPLPTGMHKEWMIKALDAKKHLLVEKSMSLDYSTTQQIVQLAAKNGLVVMENFMFKYHSQHQIVKELILSGTIGEIRCFRASFGFPPLDRSNFRYNKELGGGALLDAGAYTISASLMFLGNDLQVKAATLNYDGCEVDIHGGAYLQSADGKFAEVAFGFDNYYQCNYEIWGSSGKIIAHRAFTPKPNQSPKITVESPNGTREILAKPDNHFKNLLLEWSERIRVKEGSSFYQELLAQSRVLDMVRKISA